MFRIELSPNLPLLLFRYHFPLPILLLHDISHPVHRSSLLLCLLRQLPPSSLRLCYMQVIPTIRQTKRTLHLHRFLSLPASSIRLIRQRRCLLEKFEVVAEEHKIDSLGWRESRSLSLSLRSKMNSQARRWTGKVGAKIDRRNLLLERVLSCEEPMLEQSQRGKERIQSELRVSSPVNHSRLVQRLRGRRLIRT